MVGLSCLVSLCAKLHVAGWKCAVFTRVYWLGLWFLQRLSGIFGVHPRTYTTYGLWSGRTKTCRPRWCSGDSSSWRNSWAWGSIGFISAMCVLTRMDIIFNGVSSLTCHRPRTGFGWTSLELHVELPAKILCAYLSSPRCAVCHVQITTLNFNISVI
jgi:hypothetical protein